MRPGYVAILFFAIGLALLAFARYGSGRSDGPTSVARKARTRTGGIFLLVAAGLVVLDVLTHVGVE